MSTNDTPDWVLYELGVGLEGRTPQTTDNMQPTATPTVQRAYPYPDAWIAELRQGGQSDDEPEAA